MIGHHLQVEKRVDNEVGRKRRICLARYKEHPAEHYTVNYNYIL